MKICILFLTCANDKEAEKISRALLKKRLVACSKKTPVSSLFLWKSKIDSAKEIMLVMESIEEKFDLIEKEIKKLHSYETFTLITIPVGHTTKKVKSWLKKELL